MKSHPNRKLTIIENEVIAEIRTLKMAPRTELTSSIFENPARIVHHFIVASHGNPQLRLATIAQELGIEMRTLQRSFTAEYRTTMAQCQIAARLAFSQWLLSIFEPTKVSAIASILGYSQVQDFNRFFKKHMHQPPSEWGRKERARIEQAMKPSSRD